MIGCFVVCSTPCFFLVEPGLVDFGFCRNVAGVHFFVHILDGCDC